MSLYPAFLDLKGRRCVVVGGGRVAQRKVGPLLRAGARIWIYSPTLTPVLDRLKEKGLIRHLPRRCDSRGLKGASLVFCATDLHEENERIASMARGLGIPVNVASGDAQSTLIVPSAVRRGPLMIAVSTSGASPAMSKGIRLELQKYYGAGFSGYLKGLSRLRQKALKDLPPAKRRRLFKRLGSSDIIRRIRAGDISSPEDALQDLSPEG